MSWSINLPETKWLYPFRRIHCPVSVLIRRRNKDEMFIILDSLIHLVDLLVREFDNENNLLGVPSLTLKRAVRSITTYFGLEKERDFEETLEYEYFRFLVETGFPSPFGFLTPRKLRTLYERSIKLKGKLHGIKTNEHEVLQEAIDILDKKLQDLE